MKELFTIKEFGNIDPNYDDLLETCFEEHEAYKSLLSLDKMLVVGKKGSGKTSIFKKLVTMKMDDCFVKGYGLSDYPWHYHLLQAEQNVSQQNKYINSWKYLILLELSKILINQDNSIEFESETYDSQKILKEFIVDTYGSQNPKLANIFTSTKKVRLNNLFSFKKGDKEYGLQLPFEEVEMKELPKVIFEINRTMTEHVMKCLNPNNNYYICFDELDIGFEKDDDYYYMIIGLIKAASELHSKAKELNNHLNVCIFLRDDIYELLRFEDKRKISQNLLVRIEWDTQRVDNTLKALMEKRFSELLKDEDSQDITWDNVFDAKRINGNNTKYDYILDFTCKRPRDIIDFCNAILSCYKEDGSKNNQFSNKDIIAAKEIYSTNFLAEFEDEIHKHLIDFDIYMDIIKRIGKVKFNFDEFDTQYETRKNRLKENKDSLTVLEELYKFSVIGNYLIGGSSGGSKKSFQYMSEKNKFDETQAIIVHMGLAPTLKLKEK